MNKSRHSLMRLNRDSRAYIRLVKLHRSHLAIAPAHHQGCAFNVTMASVRSDHSGPKTGVKQPQVTRMARLHERSKHNTPNAAHVTRAFEVKA